MIVKNEEEMLAGCLESAKDCVDEMIVVDTGSTDRTKEIATELGAVVYDFEWIEDFAAARNFAKSKCSSDYVIALDADERLNPEDGELLRSALNEANPAHNVIFVILSNSKSRFASIGDVLNGKERQGSPVLLPRILKNVEGNDWRGVIHESPQLDNGQFGRIDANIVHLGGDMEWRESRQKSERNLDLLLKRRDSGIGHTPLFWSYLATEFSNAGRKKEFVEALEKGWEGLQEAIELKTMTNNGIISIYPSILFQQGRVKEGMEALQYLIQNFEYASPNPANLLYYCATAMLDVDVPLEFRDNLYESLIEIANMLLEWDGVPFLGETFWGITDHKAYEILAFAYLKTKRFDEADEAIDKGFEYKENSYALQLLRIENNLERGDIQTCLAQIMEELNSDINRGPDIWILAATACVILGYEDDARDFLEQAQFRSRMTFVSRHRTSLLRGLLTRQSVLSGNPKAGNGMYGVLGAILSRSPMRTSMPVPNDIIKKVLHRLLELGKVDLIERFFDARAESLLPGVGKIVVQYLSELGIVVEDDGLLTPIFLVGESSADILPIFSGKGFTTINFDAEVTALIEEKWLEHETEASEAFLFGDLSFLDDDEEENKETAALQEVRAALTAKIRETLKEGTRPVVVFDDVLQCVGKILEIFPKTVFVYYSVDPRVLASQKQVSSEDELNNLIASWKLEHEKALCLSQINKSNYIVMNNQNIKTNEDWLLINFFALLGEVYDDSVLDAWKKLDYEADIDQKYNDIIEQQLQNDLQRWGMK